MDTPEMRRDAAVAEIIAAGGSILSTEPLAHPNTPHVVAAYRVTAGAADPVILAALAPVRADTQITAAGLIPWTPEPEPEPEDVS